MATILALHAARLGPIRPTYDVVSRTINTLTEENEEPYITEERGIKITNYQELGWSKQ
jgi:hypothetical protein